MKTVLNILIFLLQSFGVILVGIGLGLIWMPLAWIYAGVAIFAFGHVLYLAVKSEGTEK